MSNTAHDTPWPIGFTRFKNSKIFVNLSNGIEAFERCPFLMRRGDISFIRIQSTHCEQKLWDDVIANLDANFLVNLALGAECVVFDYGAHSPRPRALWQGLSFVAYCIERVWMGRNPEKWFVTRAPASRGHNCVSDFKRWFAALNGKSITKLKYYRKYLNCDNIILCYITGKTDKDGNYKYYSDLLKTWHENRMSIVEAQR